MSVGIAFDMSEIGVNRNEFLHKAGYVLPDIGVRILIDGYASCGVGDMNYGYCI